MNGTFIAQHQEDFLTLDPKLDEFNFHSKRSAYNQPRSVRRGFYISSTEDETAPERDLSYL